MKVKNIVKVAQRHGGKTPVWGIALNLDTPTCDVYVFRFPRG